MRCQITLFELGQEIRCVIKIKNIQFFKEKYCRPKNPRITICQILYSCKTYTLKSLYLYNFVLQPLTHPLRCQVYANWAPTRMHQSCQVWHQHISQCRWVRPVGILGGAKCPDTTQDFFSNRSGMINFLLHNHFCLVWLIASEIYKKLMVYICSIESIAFSWNQ